MIYKKKNEISKKCRKIQKSEIFENIFVLSKKEKNILLVLPFEEISIRPELPGPPRFRIQGGGEHKRDGGGGRTKKGNRCV